jgi:hypothetical protein
VGPCLTTLTNLAYFTCKHGERSVNLLGGAVRKRKGNHTERCWLSSMSVWPCPYMSCVCLFIQTVFFYFTTALMCADYKKGEFPVQSGFNVCLYVSLIAVGFNRKL